MFSLGKQTAVRASRSLTIGSVRNYKVCIIGGAGGIGQPLALLLKVSRLITHLAIYDTAKHAAGVGVDLSHIKTEGTTFGFTGPENVMQALTCSDIVMCAAGAPQNPGMSRDDLFELNACTVVDAAENVATYCPHCLFAIITNPVNTLVPLAAEILKKKKVYDPRKLFGVTTLDTVRACTFISEINKCDPSKVKIPIIGGHSQETCVPLLSLCEPKLKADKAQAENLIKRIKNAGTEVVSAKVGTGGATLSMAYAAAILCETLMRGLRGERNIVECCYVESTVTKSPFISAPLLLGRDGIEKHLGLPPMEENEKKMLDAAIPVLIKNCQHALDFLKPT